MDLDDGKPRPRARTRSRSRTRSPTRTTTPTHPFTPSIIAPTRTEKLFVRSVPLHLFTVDALSAHISTVPGVTVTHVNLRGDRDAASRRTAVVTTGSPAQATLAMTAARSSGVLSLPLAYFRPSGDNAPVATTTEVPPSNELLFSFVPEELFSEEALRALFAPLSQTPIVAVSLKSRPHRGSVKRTAIITFSDATTAAHALEALPPFRGQKLHVAFRAPPVLARGDTRTPGADAAALWERGSLPKETWHSRSTDQPPPDDAPPLRNDPARRDAPVVHGDPFAAPQPPAFANPFAPSAPPTADPFAPAPTAGPFPPTPIAGPFASAPAAAHPFAPTPAAVDPFAPPPTATSDPFAQPPAATTDPYGAPAPAAAGPFGAPAALPSAPPAGNFGSWQASASANPFQMDSRPGTDPFAKATEPFAPPAEPFTMEKDQSFAAPSQPIQPAPSPAVPFAPPAVPPQPWGNPAPASFNVPPPAAVTLSQAPVGTWPPASGIPQQPQPWQSSDASAGEMERSVDEGAPSWKNMSFDGNGPAASAVLENDHAPAAPPRVGGMKEEAFVVPEPSVSSADDARKKNQEDLERRQKNLQADMAELRARIARKEKERDETLAAKAAKAAKARSKSNVMERTGVRAAPKLAASSTSGGTGAWRKVGARVDFESAEQFVGTCETMCPAKEIEDRQEQGDLSAFELKEGYGHTADPERMVKKYRRSAAISEQPLPVDVRPPVVLARTMEHLKRVCDTRGAKFVNIHNFVRDRTRSLRQDYTFQGVRDESCIKIHEESVRFHIMSGHRLYGMDPVVFSAKQNYEQLDKCLISLREMYALRREQNLPMSPNEPEMQSYYILMRLSDAKSCVELCTGLPLKVRRSKHVQFALQVANFASSFGNAVRFFSCVRGAPYLTACLMHSRFIQVRCDALSAMNVAHGVSNSKDSMDIPELTRRLGFDRDEETVDFCTLIGLDLRAKDSYGLSPAQFEVRTPSPAFDPSKVDQWIPRKSTVLIEGKVRNLVASEIISGVDSDLFDLSALPAAVSSRINDASAKITSRVRSTPVAQISALLPSKGMYGSAAAAQKPESTVHMNPVATKANVLPTTLMPPAHLSVQKPEPVLPSDKPSPVRFFPPNHGTVSQAVNAPYSAVGLKQLSFGTPPLETTDDKRGSSSKIRVAMQNQQDVLSRPGLVPSRKFPNVNAVANTATEEVPPAVDALRMAADDSKELTGQGLSEKEILSGEVRGVKAEINRREAAEEARVAKLEAQRVTKEELEGLRNDIADLFEKGCIVIQSSDDVLTDAERGVEDLVLLQKRCEGVFESLEVFARELFALRQRTTDVESVCAETRTIKEGLLEELDNVKGIGHRSWKAIWDIMGQVLVAIAGVDGPPQTLQPAVDERYEQIGVQAHDERAAKSTITRSNFLSYLTAIDDPLRRPEARKSRAIDSLPDVMQVHDLTRWQGAVFELAMKGSASNKVAMRLLDAELSAVQEEDGKQGYAIRDSGVINPIEESDDMYKFSVYKVGAGSELPQTCNVAICGVDIPEDPLGDYKFGNELMSMLSRQRSDSNGLPPPVLIVTLALAPSSRAREDEMSRTTAFVNALHLDYLRNQRFLSSFHVVHLAEDCLEGTETHAMLGKAVIDSVSETKNNLEKAGLDMLACPLGERLIGDANSAWMRIMDTVGEAAGPSGCESAINAVNQSWLELAALVDQEIARCPLEFKSVRKSLREVRNHIYRVSLPLPRELGAKRAEEYIVRMARKAGVFPPVRGFGIDRPVTKFCGALGQLLRPFVCKYLGEAYGILVLLPRNPRSNSDAAIYYGLSHSPATAMKGSLRPPENRERGWDGTPVHPKRRKSSYADEELNVDLTKAESEPPVKKLRSWDRHDDGYMANLSSSPRRMSDSFMKRTLDFSPPPAQRRKSLSNIDVFMRNAAQIFDEMYEVELARGKLLERTIRQLRASQSVLIKTAEKQIW